jgi:hypothetical protein
MMGRKTLLFLGGTECQVRTWQNGKLSAAECFADNAGGQEKFTTFLQTHREPVYLLTDLVEEDFRHESVPHLHGNDRAALIQRKLEQYYRNTPFRMASTLQRSKDGRRDEDMLFSALTNPALITPWLNSMQASNIPLAGIYSLANVSSALTSNMSSSCLLLSWEKHAGLRQTYFNEKMLRFSRLTSINDSNPFVATAGTEALRTQQYLKNLSLLPPDQALNVTLICHSDDRAELEKLLHDDTEIHYTYLDIQDVGKKIGSKSTYLNSDATQLFLHLLATHPPRNNYAAAEHTHLLQLRYVRRSLLGLSATLAAASLMLSAANISTGITMREESQALNLQASQLSQQTRKFILSFPDTLASAKDMKTAVFLSRKLDSIFPPPQVMLEGLSKTLDDYPTIRINKISWRTSATEETTLSAATSRNSATVIIPAQILLLNGELEEFTGDYRGALEHLERFRQALILRGYSVTALTLPLDVSPQGNLDAETCNGNNLRAQFSLKILWRPVA